MKIFEFQLPIFNLLQERRDFWYGGQNNVLISFFVAKKILQN